MKDLVTVIIPAFNATNLIKNCVLSIVKSTYRELEILIIDDGSTADAARFYDELELIDERISVIHQAHCGVSAARNTGIECAKGDYITFVNADHMVDENLIWILVDESRRNEADVVSSGFREFYRDGSTKDFYCNERIDYRYKYRDEILSDFFDSERISWKVWAKLYTRKIIGTTRFRTDRRNAADMFFNYEILKKPFCIVECGYPWYSCIQNDNSVMPGKNDIKYLDSFRIMQEIFDDKDKVGEFAEKKNLFYVKNSLFFFWYMYAKKNNSEIDYAIERARMGFLKRIEGIKLNLGLRMAAEVKILKHINCLFQLVAKVHWLNRTMYFWHSREMVFLE